MTTSFTIDGITGYLVSLSAYGCGEVTCRRIAEALGPEAVNIILNEPQRLLSIEGIGEQKKDSIHHAVSSRHGSDLTAKERRRNRRRMEQTVFLEGIGIHSWALSRILDRYGDKAEEQVRENPYRLTELAGFAWRTADKVARGLGIDGSDPRRIDACIIYTLEDRAQRSGHCYLLLPQLVVLTRANLRLSKTDSDTADTPPTAEAIAERIEAMTATEHIITDGDAIYLPRLYWAEITVAATLHRLMDYCGPSPSRISEWGREMRNRRHKSHTDYEP